MTARSQYPQPADSTGTAFLAPDAPHISPSSSLLASVIPLPDTPIISYSVYQCPPEPASSHALALIDDARRSILQTNTSPSILDNLLTSLHISPINPVLYVFAISSHSIQSSTSISLASLHLDGLDLVHASSFSPTALYPCSLACSTQPLPCPSCIQATSSTPSPLASSSSTHSTSALLLPRKPLRRPFFQFLQAVRDHLINDITHASATPSPPTGYRPATRLRDGFLLSSTSVTSEWGSGWEHTAFHRPLIHCQLQIHLSLSVPPKLIVHPLLRPTHYIPLHTTLPLPPGTPITLLPHGVPAYFLSVYSGPTSALNAQFDDALLGLGVSSWKGTSLPKKAGSHELVPPYVVAWLAVQNKQGEDKGLPVIWPLSLCLAFIPGAPSSHARATLKCIPELPAQLQSSPPASAPPIPFGDLLAEDDDREGASPMSTSSSCGRFPSQNSGTPVESINPFKFVRSRRGSNYPRRPRTLSRSPVSDSLLAFKALTLSRNTDSIQAIAPEISDFVDAMARERERERERIKRERENGSRVNLSSSSKQIPSPQPSKVRGDVTRPVLEALSSKVPPQLQHSGLPTPQLPAPKNEPSQQPLLPPVVAPDVGMPGPSPSNQHEVTPKQPATIVPPTSSTTPPMPDALSAPFPDPFGGFDPSWPQSGNDFMNMDYEMDFDMDLGTMSGNAGGAGDAANDFGIDDGYGVFTDDDFNVFDDPAETKVASTAVGDHALSLPTALASTSGIPASLGISSPSTGDPLHISGPGPPSAGLSTSSPWATHPLGDMFTPHTENIPPELLPPSPGKTPSSYSAPATPSVQLTDARDPFLIAQQRSSHIGFGPSEFDPIPFAASHKIADGKYAVGKFSLPSPPNEDDRTEGLFTLPWAPASYPNPSTVDWQKRYSQVTDPRFAVVRMLVGAKRRREDQGGRPSSASPRWSREYEEWETASVQPDEPKSESDEDDDDNWVEEEETITNTPRPVTPPPSYLPMGAALLQTYFLHRHLLPLSVPLRVPGAVVNNAINPPAPMSVPTPVSPAAILGAASEKTKSLEAAAQILVREIVENRVWADAWRSHSTAGSISTKSPVDIRQFDSMAVASFLKQLQPLQVPLDLQTLYEAEDTQISVQLMSPPMFSVGKSGAVTQVLPTALRFWDKLGLSPKTGKKDVTAYVFFEGIDERDEDRVAAWLQRLCSIYSAKHFGAHAPGKSSSCTRDGIMPILFDSCRKTVSSFVASLLPTTESLVFYVITPSSIINMASPSLRHVLSAIKKVLRTHTDTQILFQLVPEALVPVTHDSTKDHSSLSDLATSVYDRVLRPVERVTARSSGNSKDQIRAYFHSPAFTLARPLPGKVKFVREAHAKTLDVADRQLMLHVGYHLTPCGKWILAASIDQRGETHDMKAWLVPDDFNDSFVVTSVWGFASSIMAKASVEWQVTVTKLGVMKATEFDAWISHLETAVVASPLLPPLEVVIFSAEYENGWTFIPPEQYESNSRPPSAHRGFKGSQGSVYADTTSSTYALFPTARIPIVPHPSREVCVDSPFIPEVDDHSDTVDRDTGILPHRSSILIHVPADTDFTTVSTLQLHMLHVHHTTDLAFVTSSEDILQDTTRNFYELSILTRVRWKLKTRSILPFHLSALEVMHSALDREDTNTD